MMESSGGTSSWLAGGKATMLVRAVDETIGTYKTG
jgi:hypothetical protein